MKLHPEQAGLSQPRQAPPKTAATVLGSHSFGPLSAPSTTSPPPHPVWRAKTPTNPLQSLRKGSTRTRKPPGQHLLDPHPSPLVSSPFWPTSNPLTAFCRLRRHGPWACFTTHFLDLHDHFQPAFPALSHPSPTQPLISGTALNAKSPWPGAASACLARGC